MLLLQKDAKNLVYLSRQGVTGLRYTVVPSGLIFKGEYMFGLLSSVVNLASDVVKVVAAPVQIAVDVVDAVVKPVADVAQDLAKDVKDSLKD